jgi:mevalonate kinase
MSSSKTPNPKSSQASLSADGDERPPNPRKPSNPLMPSFMVSAPGKVIVYGEHAVVHGKVGEFAGKKWL